MSKVARCNVNLYLESVRRNKYKTLGLAALNYFQNLKLLATSGMYR